MVFGQLASFFFSAPSPPPQTAQTSSSSSGRGSASFQPESSYRGDGAPSSSPDRSWTANMEVKNPEPLPFQEDDADLEDARPPYVHAALAGGSGGVSGDMLLHSLDTVKTRQQGDPNWPPKYRTIGNTYVTIFKQEGVARGLYGGVGPAFVGSFLGTALFFTSYEFTKRTMIDNGIAPSVAYFSGGFFADLAASPVYVPTEVVKTRLQLQGRFNNPHFNSGYNYRSTMNAVRSMLKHEGASSLFRGYGATLWRDLPFSALQFAFYEKERQYAKAWVGSKNIGLPLEIFVAVTAGGLAGVITCPFDVVKTRLQTQLHTAPGDGARSSTSPAQTAAAATTAQGPPSHYVKLESSSMIKGLGQIYGAEGVAGMFRGVGPRGVWTAIQSGTMLVLYQILLGHLEEHPLVRD